MAEQQVFYSEFSYKQLNKRLRERKPEKQFSTDDKLYMAQLGGDFAPVKTPFILIEKSSGIQSSSPRLKVARKRDQYKVIKTNPLCEHQLKFHVSLPEQDPAGFALGFDIVKEILLSHKVGKFKVVRVGWKMSDSPNQRGKDITIYAIKNPEMTVQKWLQILTEITQQLADNNIPPGYRPPLFEADTEVQDQHQLGNEPANSAVRPLDGNAGFNESLAQPSERSAKTKQSTAKMEKAILGSNYIAYRYEHGWPQIDPFAEPSNCVKVEHQAEPTVWPPDDAVCGACTCSLV